MPRPAGQRIARLAALTLTASIAACGPPTLPGLELDRPTTLTAQQILCEAGATQLHAVATGPLGAPAVLFLHGTPGRWNAFEHFLADPRLNSRLRLVSVDRLGWGASPLPDGGVEPDFAPHAAALAPLISALDEQSGGAGVVLVGHSLGASLAPALALAQPERVSGLLLLAGSHDPELRARRWYNLLADLPPVRWLLPEDLARSNDEIMALPAQLEAIAPRWSQIAAHIVVIQGDDDPLVSPGHADFVEARAAADRTRILRLAETNHFIPWNRSELIREELLALVDRSVDRSVLGAHPGTRPGAPTAERTNSESFGGGNEHAAPSAGAEGAALDVAADGCRIRGVAAGS